MSDWQCVVCRVERIEKHPDADTLSIAYVLGDNPVVIKTGQYILNQLVGYLAVNTITPDTDQFYFLCPRAIEQYEENGEIKKRDLGPKYPLGSVKEQSRRIRAKRIRGTFSMGMLVDVPAGLKEGDSIVEALGLKKYEDENEENVSFRGKKISGANAEKAPQGWSVPFYDIDALRKYHPLFQEGEEVVLLEKCDGSNACFVHDGNRLWCKSRNWFKRQSEEDMWWDVATRYDLANKLARFPTIAFFGEVYGQVKGMRYDVEIVNGRLEPKIRFFDAWDTKTMRFLDFDVLVSMTQELDLPLVPILYRGAWTGKDNMFPYAEGMTTLGGKHLREGFTVRPTKERYEAKLDGRLQLKLIGEGFALAK